MTATQSAAAVTVITPTSDFVTLPFEFELEVTGGFENRDQRDPVQLALLTGAWSVWWSQFALDMASPEEDAFPGRGRKRVIGKAVPREGAAAEANLWDIGLVHPAELAGPGGGMEYRLAPLSTKRSVSGDFSVEEPPLIERIQRTRRPGPDEGFAFALGAGSALVRCEAQLFCVGIPWKEWQRPLPKGVHPFELVVFEVGFNDFDAWTGSLNTKGSGWVRWAAGALLVPLMVAAATPTAQDFVEQQIAKHQINARIHSMHGADCFVRGHITLDLSNLSAAVEAKLRGNSREDMCMFQAALRAIGEDPGAIDGIYGRDTKAAEEAFRTKWHLQGTARDTPQFSLTLVKALRGYKPDHQ